MRRGRDLGLWIALFLSITLCEAPVGLGAPAQPRSPSSVMITRPDLQRMRPAAAPDATSHRPVIGKLPVLVVLTSFSDQPSVGTDAKHWNRVYFGATKSVKDYYREVSYHQLDLVPAEETFGTINDGIVGWIKLPYAHPNPGEEINIGNEDIVEDVLFFADKYVDFLAFDKNGNGALSTRELLVIIIVAGYEASYATLSGGATCAPSVWSHVASFGTERAPIQDGVRILSGEHSGAYAQSGEWHCSTDDDPGHAATLGVLAHEVGHLLGEGAPDLYDRDGSSAGVGNWDLMGNGAWNGIEVPGDTPAHMSAWTKYYLGWVTPRLVTSPLREAAIPRAEASAEGIYQLLENPSGNDWMGSDLPGEGEYFLIENRQKIGYDAALPGAGLLIWHVDESQSGNQEDRRKLLDLVEASREQDLDCVCNENFGDTSDPFPGENELRIFDDQTAPSARLYTGVPSRISISNISNSGIVMTADLSVIQVRPGDPWLLFDETFENGSDWEFFSSVELVASDLCAGATRPASKVWYFGNAGNCRYIESAQLLSDERPLPPGTMKLGIQFLHYLEINKQDRVELHISFDGGTKWRRVWMGRQPVKKEWKTVTANVPVPRNVTSVMLRFSLIKLLRSTGGKGWLIDNIRVTGSSNHKKNRVTSVEKTSPREGSEFETVQLDIFDLQGQLIFSAQGDEKAVVRWHLEDKAGRPVPNGLYLYVLYARDHDGNIFINRVQKFVVAR
jgi:M6 family metalloprotease-like protein